jgi:hypothetical protein
MYRIRIIISDKLTSYRVPGAYPGGMHRMYVHPPSPPVHPPPPQPERLVMRGGGGGRSAKNVHPPGKILGTPLPGTITESHRCWPAVIPFILSSYYNFPYHYCTWVIFLDLLKL